MADRNSQPHANHPTHPESAHPVSYCPRRRAFLYENQHELRLADHRLRCKGRTPSIKLVAEIPYEEDPRIPGAVTSPEQRGGEPSSQLTRTLSVIMPRSDFESRQKHR